MAGRLNLTINVKYPPMRLAEGTPSLTASDDANASLAGFAFVDSSVTALTTGSIAVTRHPAGGGQFDNAPYFLDLDKGRTLQFLGPIF
jgi:hypothetical protein